MIELDNNQTSYAQYAKEISCKNVDNPVECFISVNKRNVIDLQYLVLLLQTMGNESRDNHKFILKPDKDHKNLASQRSWSEDWAHISSYLACFKKSVLASHLELYSGEDGYKYSYLQDPSKMTFERIIPFIPINFDTYNFLSARVEEQFTSSVSHSPIKHLSMFEFSNISAEKNEAIRIIKKACLDYLFSGKDARSTDYSILVKERIEKYSSTAFYKKVKDMSVLSFVIFCAQNKFCLLEGLESIKDEAKKNSKKRATFNRSALLKANVYVDDAVDENTMINAMDMAEGLLQLIENVVFYAGDCPNNGSGILSFRIYKKSTKTWDDYLIKQYAKYFDGYDNRANSSTKDASGIRASFGNSPNTKYYGECIYKSTNQLSSQEIQVLCESQMVIETREELRAEPQFYLEVKILDNSGRNMCDVFLKNLEKRQDTSFSNKKISVSTFFNPNAGELTEWENYTSNVDNVVHHYGLQLFDALVQSLDGCFVAQSIAKNEIPNSERNIYSTSGDQMFDSEATYFPGTQYSILLPFNKRKRKDYSFVNTYVAYPLPQIDYSIIDCSDIKLSKFQSRLVQYKTASYTNQEEKNRFINLLFKDFCEYSPLQSEIIVFDSYYLNMNNMEIFAKSLMRFIAKNCGVELNIAIVNCGEDTFKQLVRIFAIFYNRTGCNNFMEKTQVYLSGSSSKDEFLLAGANLKATLVAQIKLNVARGITSEVQSGTTSFLIDMLERRPGSSIPSDIKFVPFDLLIKNKGLSVFEENIRMVLESDVQMRNPGCKISPNHMRIGSKIHVDSFFEALVLFSNNYYTGRFAWLVRKIIKDDIKLCNPTSDSPYLFIGYEVYSEMLLLDLCKIFVHAEFCLFEYGTRDMYGKKERDRFRHIESLNKSKTYIPIYIVPISSTLSTFNKLEAEFIKNDFKVKLASIKTYISVIQTRDKKNGSNIEKKYFHDVITGEHKIVSNLLKNQNGERQSVYYLFCAQSSWSDPIYCEQCYPKYFFTERPLIETDKTSVIPSQLYGLKDIKISSGKFNSYKYKCNIDDLKGYIRFGHVEQGANHFRYYIKTGEFFENEIRKCDSEDGMPRIISWLEKEVKEKIESSETLRYDIIVCPEPSNNTGFVKLVNDKVFSGASLIISIDIEKEFRDNFKAKHSDLTNIYFNLEKYNCTSEINFHFIDDAIVRGNHISRARSLVHSLFPLDAYDHKKIKINVFKSIVLLINRNSKESIMNYVTDCSNFHAYLDIYISALRTHSNACILCQKTSDYDLLSKRSASLALSKCFKDKCEESRIRGIYDKESATSIRLSDRNFLRFRCDHNLKEVYSSLGKNENSKVIAFKALLEKIECDCRTVNMFSPTPSLELLISYIVVASSPYLSFRKSCREAAFALIQILFEVSLHNEQYDYETQFRNQIKDVETTDLLTHEEISEFYQMLQFEALHYIIETVRSIPSNTMAKKDLIKMLIKQSVELKSNFIIRKENIIRIIKFSVENQFDLLEDENKEGDIPFIDYYLYNVKKLIALGTDEAKSMFLEYLLLSGDEYTNLDCALGHNDQFGEEFLKDVERYLLDGNVSSPEASNILSQLRTLFCNLYLENTQIIFDATTDLYNKRKDVAGLSDPYYLDNFYKLLKWNNIDSDAIVKKLIKLKEHLHTSSEDNGGVLVYFNNLSSYVCQLLNAAMSYCNTKTLGIYFVSERDEDVLIVDKDRDNIVRSSKRQAWDCFACNDDSQYQEYINGYGGKIAEIIEKAQEELLPLDKTHTHFAREDCDIFTQSGYTQSTYLESENKDFYILNLGESSQEKDKDDKFAYTPIIRMIINFNDACSDYQKLKAIRFILAFRHQICMKKDTYLKNDLLLSHLHDIAAKKQMQKARAGEHDNESDFAQFSPRNYVESVHLNQQSKESFYYKETSALFGYYINATIGRINIKLLADSDVATVDAEIEQKWCGIKLAGINEVEVKALCKKLSAIKYLPMITLAHLFDKTGKEISPEHLYDYFNKNFGKLTLLRNVHDQVPKLDYIVVFIAELINSAIKYSPSPHNICFSCENDGYFYISNDLVNDSQISRIHSGLRRENDGISLATICGYFDRFYKESKSDLNGCCMTYGPRVKIQHHSGSLSLGLPLFQGDA